MPVTRFKPVPANESSASDEESKLELYLQKQLEEDVARIFDESIYSDLEVVCGKLKILTHTCILKARTNKFYHKLETILHVNIERHTFDEIYSFISDAYTECDIKTQEREIIKYLKANFLFLNTDKAKTGYAKEEEADVFLTPKCVSPYAEGKILKLNGTSPNTELTREYYALVPIEGNLLEQELSEQDALSNAFHSIIKTQNKDPLSENLVHHVKPTTLSLISSHSSKTVKHSISCDIISNCRTESTTVADSKVSKENNIPNKQIIKFIQQIESKITTERVVKKTFNSEYKIDRALDAACSPDSLIADDPSSSSDYLSAAFNCSPGLGSTEFFPQLNVGENFTKMDNIFTSSDSGLENTGLLESLSSHKDVTLTDFSLTESALHESGTDDQNPSIDCTSNSYAESDQCLRFRQYDTNADTSLRSLTSVAKESEGNGLNVQVNQKDVDHSKTSKEEKQRQNEEIVILESSSVSSETGSWESIFPPKGTDKEICEKFLNNERSLITDAKLSIKQENLNSPPSTQIEKVECKPTSCFIDASSLVDEEEPVKVQVINDTSVTKADSTMMPSKPVPCSSTHKLDISPGDWSESNDNDDSLEQADIKDPDSIQKDLSPTIFEMTPITEDSLCTNAFESAVTNRGIDKQDDSQKGIDLVTDTESLSYASTVYVATTPHNSILSVNTCHQSVKQFDIEETSNENVTICEKAHVNLKKSRCDESSPIVSGGSSLVSHTPQFGSNDCNLDAANDLISHDNGITSSWVVDMSFSSKSDTDKNQKNYYAKKPGDKACEGLKSESKDRPDGIIKSRGSVDSDSSEKSSHKFYIDLSSLPDPLPPKKPTETETNNEKKNIFSMYIDLGDKAPVKEMPVRLSSSLNVKKQNETKLPSKINKPLKTSNTNTKNTISTAKILECESVFEEIESLCNDPNISITEIIGIPEKSKLSKVDEIEKDLIKEKKHSRSVNGENKVKQNSIPVIHEEITHKSSGDLFVRLSDLDKPIQKSEITMHDIQTEKEGIDVRMTRSIPDNNWGEQNSSMASRSIEVLSSFHSENALSLNRLFPHLKNEFSKSMPGSLSARTRSPFRPNTIISPAEVEDQVSDVSELSSVQSSMCRSVVENSTTEETSQTSSLIGNCQSRLGQDLLRMFLEEIAPDVIVEVSGKRIKAHKCILSSRCQYFAGILSGGWVESAGNVIVLPPFSFNVVHFALCHIYSGLSTIPDSISIVELATIADMLGLEGLKEAIMFTLKAKYCHHFHRPCQVCTAGVLECFPLSSVYGLDDLYRKCLRWITKYFSKVWPTKAFATLPKELLDKCYQEHIVNLSTENLIETVCGCGITVASLQSSRWAEIVARMCRRLVNAVAHFAAPRLVCVLKMIASVSNDAPQSAKQALDDCLTAAIEWAPPDETCRAYAFLSNLVKEIRCHQYSRPDVISNGNEQMKVTDPNNLLYTHAGSWRLQCEGTLVRAAPRVVGTQAFKDLPSDLRKRLRELGCIMYGPQAIPIMSSPLQDRKSKSVFQSKPNKIPNSTATRSLDMEQVRQSFVPYKAKPISMGGTEKIKSTNELREKKPNKSIPPKVRTTKAQEERAKFNQIKTNLSQDRLNTKSRPHPFENTKPRYLEPRPCKNDNKKLSTKKLMNKIVSSSESSRNSSPVLARNLRTCGAKAKEVKAQTMSQDSLATSSRPRTAEPSTDSLSESQTSNKYATYTKTKHTCRGSVESVRSSKGVISSLHSSNNRTKIPVYLNQNSVPNNYEYREPEVIKRPGLTVSNRSSESKVVPATLKLKNNKINMRNVPGSLMNATKSSSAKMVTKIVKDGPQTNKVKQRVAAVKNPRHHEPDRPRELPVMGRSGTFLKDEPTFGDKTTNIDIGQ